MIGKILKSLALIMIRPSNQSHCRGYTLTELVVVVTVVAILAVVAMPKLMDTSGFSARTGADQLVAAFQFAQTAAQQQDVATAVNVSSSGFSVTQNGSVVQGFSGPYPNRPEYGCQHFTSRYDCLWHEWSAKFNRQFHGFRLGIFIQRQCGIHGIHP
jgi:prepilin-type N-terminal cleavage/methylation domain-containing protein